MLTSYVAAVKTGANPNAVLQEIFAYPRRVLFTKLKEYAENELVPCLKMEEITRRLSLDELIEVAGKLPSLAGLIDASLIDSAARIIASPHFDVIAEEFNIDKSLPREQLKWLVFAKIKGKILGDLFAKLNGKRLALLCRSSDPLFQQLIVNQSALDRLLSDHINILSEEHYYIALSVLKFPQLREKLTGANLVHISIKYPELIPLILADRDLHARLSSDNLAALGKIHETIMASIPDRSELRSKFEDLERAKEILNDVNLSAALTGENLIDLCDEHPCLESVVFSQPELVTKLMASLKHFRGTSHSISFCEGVVNHVMFSTLPVNFQRHFRVEVAAANNFLALLCPDRCLRFIEGLAKANDINNLAIRVRSLTK